MFQTMQNILARVSEIGSQQILIIGCLTLCLRWIPVISVERLSRSSVSLTHCQHRQNSQPISKVNEIRAFDYPILVIPRWDRQTIHYMILLTEIGAKNESRIMSYIRAHFSHSYEKKRKSQKFFSIDEKNYFLEKKKTQRTWFSLRELQTTLCISIAFMYCIIFSQRHLKTSRPWESVIDGIENC